MPRSCLPGLSPLSLQPPFSRFSLLAPFALGRLLVEASPLDLLENALLLHQTLQGLYCLFDIAVVDVYVHSISFSIFLGRRLFFPYLYRAAGGLHQHSECGPEAVSRSTLLLPSPQPLV